MTKTAQPERPRSDRRKRNRREEVELTHSERMEFVYWYSYLYPILHRELRAKEVKLSVFKPKNKNCALPQDAVRQELEHIFQEDWKCALAFNDIDEVVHMRDLR